MSYRLTQIYTRTGDNGTTSLEPHHRIPKDHARIETLGTLNDALSHDMN